ncbi:hypothetical protein SDRG_10396 [Saprolegnia diclina VS20]|uniref:F-box domain-containing protein n=1 Tax=Saprolegnia diclina (strain VS20) TaxID=1156394 RepID=T0RHU1_SAPDV|nr:hypothetical protein SDRG_10396 [Saprolegnia diclina VS20]EQC31878.1 hypothetical protein SDRG_10396 [Saprolegnia diclina VS20]|eukprot:XP_008614606.1 hypothetical protein SDRG_10396 [Saprolegnia diclina VS20]
MCFQRTRRPCEEWRVHTSLDDGIDACWPFLRVRAREMKDGATPITTHAAAVAPFVPKVTATVHNLHECLWRVLRFSHLVTHTTVLHSERAGNMATVLADDGTALCDALAGCPRLETFSIQYDYEDYTGSMAYVNNILAIIDQHPRILRLDIAGSGSTTTKLTPRTTERIIQWLRSRPAVSLCLFKTDLTMCYVGKNTLGEALAQAVAASTTLEYIELDSLRYFDVHGLHGLPLPVTTRVFRWSNVGLTDTVSFGDVVANNLGQSLAPASRLEELHVTYTRALRPAFLNRVLSHTLPSMPQLHTLSLDGIVFQNACMPQLFDVRPMMPALASLHLDNTRLSNLSVAALAAVLPHCAALRRVLVGGGTYTEASTAALLSTAAAMPRLEHLAVDTGETLSEDAVGDGRVCGVTNADKTIVCTFNDVNWKTLTDANWAHGFVFDITVLPPTAATSSARTTFQYVFTQTQ